MQRQMDPAQTKTGANQTLLTNRASVEKGGQYNSDGGNSDGGMRTFHNLAHQMWLPVEVRIGGIHAHSTQELSPQLADSLEGESFHL